MPYEPPAARAPLLPPRGGGLPADRSSPRLFPGGPLLPQPLFRGDVQPWLPDHLTGAQRPARRPLRAGFPARRPGPGGLGEERPELGEPGVGDRSPTLPRPGLLGVVRERLPACPADAAPAGASPPGPASPETRPPPEPGPAP